MQAEASELSSQTWVALEGHAVNGVFPLRRYLGGSDHSGVFLSDFAGREPSQVAIKLIPAPSDSTLANSQLSRWLTAADLDHPHLLRVLEAGRCQVDGLHYLYAVMEFADQTLAQLLGRRALTEDEVREMLVPALKALAFLHHRELAHGRLSPSNVLVVGDALKLASDAMRPSAEGRDNLSAMSVYDAPEGREGMGSAAGDIWALGVTLCEALTRRRPAGSTEGGGRTVLPPDLSPAFRELIARCLSRSPYDRPSVAEIEAWVGGQPLAPARAADLAPEATIALLEPVATAARAAAAVPPQALPNVVAHSVAVTERLAATASQATSVTPPPKPQTLPLITGAVIVVVLAWAGMRALKTDEVVVSPTTRASSQPAVASARDVPLPVPAAPRAVSETGTASAQAAGSQTSSAPRIRATPTVVRAAAPVESRTVSTPRTDAAVSPSSVHEEIPNVPRRAQQTIRGHVKVSVRVIVSPDGTVFAALTEDRGPSRYFERLAMDAAKKWTFTAVDAGAQRIALVRFDFTRDGTTARAVTVR